MSSDVVSPSDPPLQAQSPGGGASSGDPLVGQVVGGRWRVLKRLGQGGMGLVYEGQNTSIGKRVALKFITGWGESPEACLRFQREAEAASAVESPHIVHVFDTGATEQGQPYLVMELLQGESLGARLRRGHRLSVAEAAHVIAQLLRGLGRAHEAGVIHRDLKPDNIFLVPQGDDLPFVKILDFGISKIARPGDAPGSGTITREGTVLGTPYYMSPEQAQALPGLDGRSDLFSVGVILFECLAGHAPWSSLGSYEAVIVAICSRDAPDVRLFAPEVPAPLAEAIKKALSREASARFSSAQDFLSAMQVALPGVLSSRGERSSPPSSPELSAESGGSATWTPREPLPAAPTPTARWNTQPSSRLWLGVVAAALAFGGTWIALRPAVPSVAAPAVVRAPPQVSMHVEVNPPGASLLVGGKALEGGELRGVALSEHEIRVEADGYEPVVRRVRLDGRPSLRIELVPLPSAAPSTSVSAAPAASHEEGSHPPPSLNAKTSPPNRGVPSPESSAGKGLQLKVKL